MLLAIAATDPATAEEPRYRILFAEHASEPIVTGEAGAHNTAEAKRIVAAMRNLAPLGTVRFVFVASRVATCGGGPGCAPEHLMWQRVNAATIMLRAHSSASADLPFRLIGFSFLEELPAGATLSPVNDGKAGIDLRLHVEAPREGPCPWRVLVDDPALPPVIGTHAGEPAVPVPAGASIAVSAGARVAIVASARGGAQPAAVWQSARGEFRRVDAAAYASAGTPLPSGATRLHLMNGGDAEVRGFVARLGDEFRRVVRAPAGLGGGTREYASRDRGFDDHVGSVARPVLPPSAARCEVKFLAELK